MPRRKLDPLRRLLIRNRTRLSPTGTTRRSQWPPNRSIRRHRQPLKPAMPPHKLATLPPRTRLSNSITQHSRPGPFALAKRSRAFSFPRISFSEIHTFRPPSLAILELCLPRKNSSAGPSGTSTLSSTMSSPWSTPCTTWPTPRVTLPGPPPSTSACCATRIAASFSASPARSSRAGLKQIFIDLIRNNMVDADRLHRRQHRRPGFLRSPRLQALDRRRALQVRHRRRHPPRTHDRSHLRHAHRRGRAAPSATRPRRKSPTRIPPRPYSSREFIREMGAYLEREGKTPRKGGVDSIVSPRMRKMSPFSAPPSATAPPASASSPISMRGRTSPKSRSTPPKISTS